MGEEKRNERQAGKAKDKDLKSTEGCGGRQKGTMEVGKEVKSIKRHYCKQQVLRTDIVTQLWVKERSC